MKKLILILTSVGVAAAAVILAVQWQAHSPQPVETVVPPATTSTSALEANSSPRASESQPRVSTIQESTAETVNVSGGNSPGGTADTASSPDKLSVASVFSQPLQTLVSPQSSYAERQAAWKQLRDTHQLDKAIKDLEQAVASDPSVAEYHAVLGQAYVQKLRTLEDFREQSLLAIKADQTFDQALKLDQTNWEARYWKALSLSYWPAELNKSPEVIDNLVTLLEQQEKRPSQPQYAQTYVLLGDQYAKIGYSDDARQTWQRGATLFPDNSTLWEKLSGLNGPAARR